MVYNYYIDTSMREERGLSRTKRQHTVPRAYLKNFAIQRNNSSYLYTYEKRNGLIHEDNINNASVEKNWYTLELSKNQLAWEEFYASEIEPRYAVIGSLISKASSLVITDRSEVLDNNEKIEIAIIMIYQLFRGRIGRKYADYFASQVMPGIVDEAEKEIENVSEDEHFEKMMETITSEDSKKVIYAEVLTDPVRLIRYARLIASRYWVVFRIIGRNEFITSDNPVTVGSINSADDIPSHLAFLGTSNVIYYPISPNLLIAAYDSGAFLGALSEKNRSIIFLDAKKESRFICGINRLMAKQCASQAYSKSKKILKRACR